VTLQGSTTLAQGDLLAANSVPDKELDDANGVIIQTPLTKGSPGTENPARL